MKGVKISEYYFIKVTNLELSSEDVNYMLSNVQKTKNQSSYNKDTKIIQYSFYAEQCINLKDYFFMIANNKMETNFKILVEILIKILQCWEEFRMRKQIIDLRFETIWIKHYESFTSPSLVKYLSAYLLEAEIFQFPNSKSEQELNQFYRIQIENLFQEFSKAISQFIGIRKNKFEEILAICQDFDIDDISKIINKLTMFKNDKKIKNDCFGKVAEFEFCAYFYFTPSAFKEFYNILFSNLQNWVIKQSIQLPYRYKNLKDILNYLKLGELQDLLNYSEQLSKNEQAQEKILSVYMIDNQYLNTLQNLQKFKLAEFEYYQSRIKQKNNFQLLIKKVLPEFPQYFKKLQQGDQDMDYEHDDLAKQKQKILFEIKTQVQKQSSSIYNLFKGIYKTELNQKQIEKEIEETSVQNIDATLAEGNISLKNFFEVGEFIEYIINDQAKQIYWKEAEKLNEEIVAKLIFNH